MLLPVIREASEQLGESSAAQMAGRLVGVGATKGEDRSYRRYLAAGVIDIEEETFTKNDESA